MYKLCKSEQSAGRQRALEGGLLKLMLTKHYDEISVRELCDQLMLPRKSFYRYFSGKDGALYALIDHTLMEYEGFSEPYEPGEGRTLRRELERFFRFWLHHRPLLDALARNQISDVLVRRSVFHALQEPVMPRRFLPEESEQLRRYITQFGVCGLMAMVLSWHREGFCQPPEELAAVAARLMERPLFPDADRFF